jgi:hypothetical protein
LFAKSGKNKGGLQGWCRDCVNTARRKPALPPEVVAEQAHQRRMERLAKKQAYYLANRDGHLQRMAANYRANQTEYKARSLRWKTENKDKWNAKCMERHTAKLRACPKWLSDDDRWVFEQAYDLAQVRERVCGGKWHVDHIVPLRGKTVSGLHVPWNLQVIPASVNCSKRNAWK